MFGHGLSKKQEKTSLPFLNNLKLTKLAGLVIYVLSYTRARKLYTVFFNFSIKGGPGYAEFFCGRRHV